MPTYYLDIVALEFPLWLRGLRTQHSVYENEDLTSDLAQWVKDPVLYNL